MKTITKISEAIAILEEFDYNREDSFFYWLEAIGIMLNLSNSEKGYLTIYFNQSRRKAER